MIVDAPLDFPEVGSYRLLGETDTTVKLARILQRLRPAARFEGFVAPGEPVAADYLVVADLQVPGAGEYLRRCDEAGVIVMPVPVGDRWSYWNFGDDMLPHLRLSQTPSVDLDVLIEYMVKDGRVAVDPASGLIDTGREAYISQRPQATMPHRADIKRVFDALADDTSQQLYDMLFSKPPADYWASHVARVYSSIQYFEALDFSSCKVVLNGGVFGGEELPFMTTKLPDDAEVHNFDPLGFDHLFPYVRPWLDAAPQSFQEHRVALADRDGEIRLHTDDGGQATLLQNFDQATIYPARSIDSIVDEAGFTRVDLIKLDLEGSDLAALHGAVETMAFFRPQLALSLYHSIGDFWHIPLLVMENCPDYDFYVRTYSCERWSTIFYGVPREISARRAAA